MEPKNTIRISLHLSSNSFQVPARRHKIISSPPHMLSQQEADGSSSEFFRGQCMEMQLLSKLFSVTTRGIHARVCCSQGWDLTGELSSAFIVSVGS